MDDPMPTRPVAASTIAKLDRKLEIQHGDPQLFCLRASLEIDADRYEQARAYLAKGVELVGADAVQVLVEVLPGRQRQLDALEAGIERRRRRAGVDVDHRRDLLGDPVARGVAGSAGAAVHGEHDGCPGSSHRLGPEAQ